MKFMRTIGCLAALSTWSLSAHGVPVYGVSGSAYALAGDESTFLYIPFDPVNNVATLEWTGGGAALVKDGVITQALNDNQFFGAQGVVNFAYGGVGWLGAKMSAFSVFGSSPSSAVASDDLSWYFDLKPKGITGSKVQIQISQLFEGTLMGAGRDDRGYGGSTRSTSFVANAPFADLDFNVVVGQGPFSVLTSKIYEFDVGEVVRMSSRLTLVGGAGLDSTISVDAFNTSKFFIDVLTVGAGYNSEDFLFPTLLGASDPGPTPTPTTPVPEPTPLALYGAALCAFALRRRMNRTRAGGS